MNRSTKKPNPPRQCGDCKSPACGTIQEAYPSGGWRYAPGCVVHRTHDEQNNPINADEITAEIKL